MIPRWWVKFKDWNGDVQYQFAGAGREEDTLTQIIINKHINRIGSHAITLKGGLDWTELIGLDWIVEVLHIPLGGSEWRSVYTGFHRTPVWGADTQGNESFISYGYDLKYLLTARIIEGTVGSAEANKSGAAETVAKEYVDEACGPSADPDRQHTRFSIEVDSGNGDNWEGDRAKRNLLEVVQEIAAVGGGDFDVIVVPDSDPITFQFVWYDPHKGTDRTEGSANPVVFSLERNNMITPVSSINRSQEFNVVYVLGQGQGATRDVEEVLDANLRYEDSPWNRREVVRQDTNQATAAELEDVGQEWIKVGGAPQEKMQFQIQQNVDLAWGEHFFLGDYVTGNYRQSIDKRVVTVRANVTQGGETLQVALADPEVI